MNRYIEKVKKNQNVLWVRTSNLQTSVYKYMLYHLDGTDVGNVLICIQIKSSAFEGFYWNMVEETSLLEASDPKQAIDPTSLLTVVAAVKRHLSEVSRAYVHG